jgi:poly(A) polymerase Pap1
VSAEESLKRAEELMDRLEATRARLETTSDPETAIDVLSELSEIAKEVEAELAKAKRETDAAS